MEITDTRVVYVHGNGNKVREELLKSQWDDALFGADLGAASRMAYWAPLRYPAPLGDDGSDPLDGSAPAAAPDGPEHPGPRGSGPRPDAEPADAFIARTLAEARHDAAPGDAESVPPAPDATGDPAGAEAALGDWLRDMTYLGDTLAEGESQNTVPGSDPGLEALPLPRPVRTAIFRLLVEHTYKDVHAYLFGGAGPAMREVFRRALDAVAVPDGGRLVVVSHSLGTIVAYEALREEQRDVDLLVTVGSPLAITEIRDALAKPPAVPAGVSAWCNASDPRDLVALDHTLRPEYAPADRVSDHLVTNDSGNHHGIREYLATKPVRDPVLALFRGLAAGRTG
ncbi:hypothetical protein [Streptomyces sp. NBC_01565]|uniref:hypothetical protein n=1 Tax=unclassified Streptomyces TaxID=2593676 RepID=UPI002259E209|nr:hypothetical protein [Streptomyces sp. NBC_01565]MCX4539559.1 hypothetical protein [Streptomyces sp. NBC_01565]